MKETRKRHLHVDYLQAANGQKWPIVYNSSTIQIAVFVKLYDVKVSRFVWLLLSLLFCCCCHYVATYTLASKHSCKP